MTVHLVQLYMEAPDGVTVEMVRGAVQNWLDEHERVLTTEEVDIRRSEPLSGEERPPWFEGTFRFSLTSSKTSLLNHAEDTLQGAVNWYILKYHGCDHDLSPTDREGCSWDDRRTWGPIPDGVQR